MSEAYIPLALIVLSIIVAGIVQRVARSKRLAAEEEAAVRHGFVRVDPVAYRIFGVALARPERSYEKGSMRVDRVRMDERTNRNPLESVGFKLKTEPYEVSFPDELGFPNAMFARGFPMVKLGAVRIIPDRFPELKNVKIDTGDYQGVADRLTPSAVAFLADFPKGIERVWIHDSRISFLVRAADFDALTTLFPMVESAYRSFS